MKTKLILLSALILTASFACKKNKTVEEKKEPTEDTAAPPATWQEHWFEHNQLLTRKYFDETLAIYYDKDVSSSVTWPNTYLAEVWNYTRQKYGNFGADAHLYAIFHTGKYSGGHPSTYFDESHDYRNVIDCGSSSATAWTAGTGNDLDLTTHEVGHIVEGAARLLITGNNGSNDLQLAEFRLLKETDVFVENNI